MIIMIIIITVVQDFLTNKKAIMLIASITITLIVSVFWLVSIILLIVYGANSNGELPVA